MRRALQKNMDCLGSKNYISDKLTNEIMTTIRAIKEYKEKYGNTVEIDQYYKAFGTYKGIADYLQKLNKASSNNCKFFHSAHRRERPTVTLGG